MARAESLLGDLDARPPAERPLAVAAMRALTLLRDGYEGRPGRTPRAALAELEQIAAPVGRTEPYATAVDLARAGLRQLVAVLDGDPSAYHAVIAQAERSLRSPGNERTAILAEVNAAAAHLQQVHLRGDRTAQTAAIRRVMGAIAALPEDDPTRVEAESTLAAAAPLLRIVEGGPEHPTRQDEIDRLAAHAAAPGLSGPERASRLAAVAGAQIDRRDLDGAIEHLEQALAITPQFDPRRAGYLAVLGVAYLERLHRSSRYPDLERAIERLEQARDLAGSEVHALWTRCAQPLAFAYRLDGRAEQARQVGLSGLRGHAWTVLLQATPADVQAAARDAAGDALDVARWCLDDGEPEAAARALDAGRGLILYAATETRDVYGRLKDDHPALAERWRHAPADPVHVPSELRRAVVSALTGIPLTTDGALAESPAAGSARLLDPPTAEEIRTALATVGADALAYLIPDAAVVVPADGPVFWIPLPELSTGNLAEFDDRAADVGADADGDRLHASRSGMDAVCDWAWRAAVGPLLVRLPRKVDRPTRVVLVPVGGFARVPWHAARRRIEGREEYALETALFSYAASARLFCESAARPAVPPSGAALIIGDPDTDGAAESLPVAGVEAWSVRETFYPTGRYLGRRPDGGPVDGAGTPAELTSWLAAPDPGAVLHLACHGALQAPAGDVTETSYLLLAGGDRLSAEELIRALGPRSDLAVVVLAACRSGETARGYDEAFSLGTAFLATGVRSAVCVQWSVPDGVTAVLMFMLHHYLRAGLPPADALRAAQLWMLADRRPPASMPAALRARVRAYRPAALQWAAFTHTGQ